MVSDTKSNASSRYNLGETIFVVGYPRSGTTWFSNLINSHPDTLYRHEVFGRTYDRFGEKLFNSLKYNNGLSDPDYEKALQIVIRANVDTDKPPFFKKSFLLAPNQRLQKFLWLGAKTNKVVERIYAFLFTPKNKAVIHPVIKETRSSFNLDSIIEGIRATKLLVLVRHPYAVVASHLDGENSGDMKGKDQGFRLEWFKDAINSRYVKELNLTEKKALELSEVEFLAIDWRIQNEGYLDMVGRHADAQVLIYEEFLEDTENKTNELLDRLGIEFSGAVKEFIYESSHSSTPTNLLSKDASSEYYSVYRGKNFNPQKWKEKLSESDIETIKRHVLGLVCHIGLDQWVD